MSNRFYALLWLCLTLPVIGFISSCKSSGQSFNTDDSLAVKKEVSLFAATIAAGVSAKGPVAWLGYFQDSPAFFMANNGQLVFHNHQSATVFIQDTLIKNINTITLHWNHLRIDPLSREIASIGSDYHEVLSFANGKSMAVDGYFTAVAIHTSTGWKLRNAHWSALSK